MVQSATSIPGPGAATAVGRRLTPAQLARRARLVDAAYSLAREGGHPAVTIDAVCKRAEVARATVYHHFGSKDHLIAEAILRWGSELQAEMRAAPPAEGPLLDRVMATLEHTLDAVEREPNLFQAAMQALVTADVGVNASERELSSLVTSYLDTIIDPDGELDTALLGMVLGHVLFSSLIRIAAGRRTREQAMEDLRATAELALGRH